MKLLTLQDLKEIVAHCERMGVPDDSLVIPVTLPPGEAPTAQNLHRRALRKVAEQLLDDISQPKEKP